jgi:hypothetical protein
MDPLFLVFLQIKTSLVHTSSKQSRHGDSAYPYSSDQFSPNQMEHEGPWELEQYLSSWCALHDPSLVAFFGSDLDKKVERERERAHPSSIVGGVDGGGGVPRVDEEQWPRVCRTRRWGSWEQKWQRRSRNSESGAEAVGSESRRRRRRDLAKRRSKTGHSFPTSGGMFSGPIEPCRNRATNSRRHGLPNGLGRVFQGTWATYPRYCGEWYCGSQMRP